MSVVVRHAQLVTVLLADTLHQLGDLLAYQATTTSHAVYTILQIVLCYVFQGHHTFTEDEVSCFWSVLEHHHGSLEGLGLKRMLLSVISVECSFDPQLLVQNSHFVPHTYVCNGLNEYYSTINTHAFLC